MLFLKHLKKIKFYNLILLTFGILGLFLFSLGLFIDYKRSLLSFYEIPNYEATKASESTPSSEVTSKLSTIVISELGIDLPIKDSQIQEGVWEISEIGVSHLNTSSNPGGGGNVIIYGHNKPDIFGPLIEGVEKGQEIELTTEDGGVYSYEIVKVIKVKPDHIDVVLPTEHEVLTIYTCTGIFDSERLVIKALPVKNTLSLTL